MNAVTAPALPVFWAADGLIPAGSDEDPTSRLLGTLSVGGVSHHAELLAVVYNDDEEIQEAADPSFQEMVDQVYSGVGGDGPWQTIEIDGRAYALIVTPYC